MTTADRHKKTIIRALYGCLHGKSCKELSVKSRHGFTLMEVLVAMAVVSMVLFSLFRVLSANIELVSAGGFYSTARLLAQKQLAVLESDLENAADGQGRFETPFDAWTWQAKVVEVDLSRIEDVIEEKSGPQAGDRHPLLRIEVEIRREDSDRTFSFAGFRFGNGILK